MSFLYESIWLWIVAAFVVAVVGYLIFLNDRKPRTLGIGVGAAILILVVGVSLYFFVDTDRKSISRMISNLASEIEKDNLPGVLEYISPRAERTRDLARGSMAIYGVPNAKFRNLNVEVNRLTHPPTAKVKFAATVYWYSKAGNPMNSLFAVSESAPQFQMADFTVELEKNEKDDWVVTDQCRIMVNGHDFHYSRVPASP